MTHEQKPQTTYQIDTQESMVYWTGRKRIGNEHHGTVSVSGGSLQVADSKLVGGSIKIDMTTITPDDLEGKSKEQLQAHLQSEDFFGVEQHPSATLDITSIDRKDDGEHAHLIHGEATIKGITNEVQVPATVSLEEDRVVLDARWELDRSRYNVRFGSGSFFQNLGDNLIEDIVNIKAHIVAV